MKLGTTDAIAADMRKTKDLQRRHRRLGALAGLLLLLAPPAARPSATAQPSTSASSAQPEAASQAEASTRTAKPTNEQPISIEADHFEMLLAENQATYTGSVVAVQGDYEIQANKLTLFFDEDNEIVSMQADGAPAKLSNNAEDPAITVSGDQMEYIFADSTIRITGNSILTQGEDKVMAEVILYNLDSEHAQAFSTQGGRVKLTLEPRNN